ncbi:MAG: hypothetical protein H6Q65_1459 [Firmicutes bacterium]|nr:hypothetical protein [Bacillota bacterium]
MGNVAVKYKEPLRMVILNMTPDELLKKVKNDFDITIGRSTLRNYVNNKLVPEPEQKVLGRGLGREATYPPGSEEEVAAANYLVSTRKFIVMIIAESRAAYNRIKEANETADFLEFYIKFNTLASDKKYDELHHYVLQLKNRDFDTARLWYFGLTEVRLTRNLLEYERLKK